MQPHPGRDSLERAREAEQRLGEVRRQLEDLTTERDAAIVAAIDDGHSLRAIGTALGMSWSGVRDRVRRRTI